MEQLKTKEDWIRAGQYIFNDPIIPSLAGSDEHSESLYVRDRQWHKFVKAPISKDGTLPFYRYTVQRKGEVRLGVLSCASCHTRVLPDGSMIIGGQGNFPMDRAFAYDYRHETVVMMRQLERRLYAADWTNKDRDEELSREAIIGRHEAIPAGVMGRHRADPRFPVVVPDLFGLQNRDYLDRTGLQLHREIGDLMRYAALNQYADDLSRFGDFVPITVFTDGDIPPPSRLERYSDEQLYALALYVYSLKPPQNPNRFDDLAARGKESVS